MAPDANPSHRAGQSNGMHPYFTRSGETEDALSPILRLPPTPANQKPVRFPKRSTAKYNQLRGLKKSWEAQRIIRARAALSATARDASD